MTRLDRYEQRTSTPLTVLAVLFLVVYAVPILSPGLPGDVVVALRTANGLVWAAFAADLVVRTALAHRRLRFLASHPVDVAAVVLPVLRPLGALRVFTATQSLLTRGGALVHRGQAISLSAGLLALVGALAELDAERGAPGATITTFGDALWWAAATVTTVGYGDTYPVTGTGRVVAVALMVVGVALVGTVTASVAAWFVAQRDDVADAQDDAQQAELAAQVAALREDVARLSAALGVRPEASSGLPHLDSNQEPAG